MKDNIDEPRDPARRSKPHDVISCLKIWQVRSVAITVIKRPVRPPPERFAIFNSNIVAGRKLHNSWELITMTVVPSSNVVDPVLANLMSNTIQMPFIERNMNAKAKELG